MTSGEALSPLARCFRRPALVRDGAFRHGWRQGSPRATPEAIKHWLRGFLWPALLVIDLPLIPLCWPRLTATLCDWEGHPKASHSAFKWSMKGPPQTNQDKEYIISPVPDGEHQASSSSTYS